MKLSIALTGPPATGKTVTYYNLLERGWRPSPTHMTREPRESEIPGRDSIFVSVEEFEANFNTGAYLEPDLDWAGYNENYYGSPCSWVDETASETPIAIMPSNILATRALCTALTARSVRDRILWVHLQADETTRRTRMTQRGDDPADIEHRLVRGDTHNPPPDADLHVDTSNLTTSQVIELIIASSELSERTNP